MPDPAAPPTDPNSNPQPPNTPPNPNPAPPIVTTPAPTVTVQPNVPPPPIVTAPPVTPPATPPPGQPPAVDPVWLRDRLNKAKESGQRAATAAYDAEARALGYESYQAMLEHLRSLGGNSPPPAPAPTPPPAPAVAAPSQPAVNVAALEEQIRSLEKRINDRDAAQAALELNNLLAAHGVSEVEFVQDLLTKAKKALPEAERASFDPGKFLTDLRGKKPFLFNEQIRPANTGPGTGGTPPAPGPGVTTRTAANGEQLDAHKMTPEQYSQRLRELGVSPHSSQPA